MNRSHFKTPHICFVSSSGGHFEQLMMLKPLMKKYNGFIVTEKTKYRSQNRDVQSYYLIQVNRKEITFPFKMAYNTIYSLVIFLRKRPNIVVSTGVLSTVPMCLIAKLFKRKLIYIESFAKVTTPTETGKLMYRFADCFYVQWKEMLQIYPKAVYMGAIY